MVAVYMLVINVTETEDGCKPVKPILRNCQTNYMIFLTTVHRQELLLEIA